MFENEGGDQNLILHLINIMYKILYKIFITIYYKGLIT